MDGVLTFFDKAVEAIGGQAGLGENATEEQKQDMYDKIEKAGEDFWAYMDWAPGGQELWNFLAPHIPVLLSSPGEFSYAKAGKQIWVQNNIPGTTLLLSSDKYRYAEMDAILIDDMSDNVGAWQELNGIGILHKDTAETIQKIKEILNREGIKISYSDILRRLADHI